MRVYDKFINLNLRQSVVKSFNLRSACNAFAGISSVNNGCNSCHHLFNREGLGNIVVCSYIKSLKHILLLVQCSYKDYRSGNLILLSKQASHCGTAHACHHNVQQQEMITLYELWQSLLCA